MILSHHYISRHIRNMNVILSMKPYFCKSIVEGVKRHEYRKAIFKCSDISKVYMYATDSICKVIGYLLWNDIICDTPSKIWEFAHKDGGVSKQLYDDYFGGCGKAYVIRTNSPCSLTLRFSSTIFVFCRISSMLILNYENFQ